MTPSEKIRAIVLPPIVAALILYSETIVTAITAMLPTM